MSLKKVNRYRGFIQLVGIESPGLTSSIPIAKMVAGIAGEIISRTGAVGGKGAEQTTGNHTSDRKALKSPVSYGEAGDQKMLCRCEGITEEEVLKAFDRIIRIGAIPTVKGPEKQVEGDHGKLPGQLLHDQHYRGAAKKKGT